MLDNNSNVLNAKFNIVPPFGCRPANLVFENKSINGSKYLWKINSVLKDSTFNFTHLFDSSGTYKISLIAFDSSSCFKSDTISQNVTVSPYAKSLFSVRRDTCSPNIIITNLTDSIQPDPITYLWDFGDGNSATTRNVFYAYSRNGDYQIQLITNPLTPCADTTLIPITYDSLSHILKADFKLNDTLLCLPVHLQAFNTSFGAKSSTWLIDNIFKDTTFNFRDTIMAPGNFKLTLIVTNDKACKKVDTITKPFSVLPAANTSFTISRDSCSLDVIFNNTSSTGQLPQVWLWNFGDGDTSNLKSPSHTYLKSNIYTIKLISNPGTYCADTAAMDWRIDGDSLQPLRVPNVFTPNGDNLNDCLTVKGVSRDCDKYHIWIRNRWGDLYFESTNPLDCWNGKNNSGDEAPEGVYFYILRIKKQIGTSIDESGTITLIRN